MPLSDEEETRRIIEKETPQRLLNNAVAFHEAGGRCDAIQKTAINPLKETFLGAPTIVCYSFAIELYLKLLILLDTGKIAKGHQLANLYRKLSPALKAKVSQNCEGWSDEEYIREQLDEASDSFVNWRYPHEHRLLIAESDTLGKIGTALHLTARQLRPDLISAFEKLEAAPDDQD